ncbi:mannose-1-phosphate guanylyltransferase [Chlorobium limicola]|nr:mannose-1-phosphate guanylyltransferase [Chlorobium limicola]
MNLMHTMPNSHVYAVIMAGGSAKALWPAARKKQPAQCLELFQLDTMFLLTVRRIASLVPPERIIVISSREGRECIIAGGTDISPENIIAEPSARNTAPCIALATAHIKKRDPDAVTVVLPSDHDVRDVESFIKILEVGIRIAAEKKGLITIGLTPTYPETEYGYIQSAGHSEEMPPEDGEHGYKLFRVKTFAEKPDYATAVQFLESRDFFWNSGVFIWHIDAICREFERSMPELYKDLLTIHEHLGTDTEDEVIEDVYSWIHPVSIDHGIMEKADPVYMLAGDFGWSDLVCWDEVARISASHENPEDTCELDVIRMESSGVFLRKPQGKLVCLLGVKDLIVVDTGDVLMICNKGDTGKVSAIVDLLRRENREEFL